MLLAVGTVIAILAFTDRQAIMNGRLSAEQWMEVAKFLGGAALVAIFLRARNDANG